MESVFCPDCPPRYKRTSAGYQTIKVQAGVVLNVVEKNYHGTSEDLMTCPSCGHVFFVSYMVDEVTRDESYEDKDRVAKLAQIKKERKAQYLLKMMVENEPGTQPFEDARKQAQELQKEEE